MLTLADTLIATSVETRFGPISFFVSESDEVVRASGFGQLHDVARSRANALRGTDWVVDDHSRIAQAVAAWSQGDLEALATVAAAQPGGPFMQEAWRALSAVPAGQVVTYQELAERAGSARAMRAAGQACARNALAPFVPCHRVIAATGIGNYGYGVALKRDLLAHEGVPSELLA